MPNVFIFSNPIKDINPNRFKNSFVIELKKEQNDQYQYFEDVENEIYYHKNFKSSDLPDLLSLIDINTLYSDEDIPDLQGFNYQILEDNSITKEEQYSTTTKTKIRNLDKYRIIELISDEWKSDDMPTANRLYGLKDLLDFYNIDRTMSACEIGSYAGSSSEIIAQYVKELKCVDIWEEYILPPEKGKIIEGEFDKVMTRNPNVIKVKERSYIAASKIKNNSLDFVYIDADHSYESVKMDIASWLPKVKNGGVIAGHDYNWGSVSKAVDEIFDNVKTFQDSSWSVRKQEMINIEKPECKSFSIIIPTYNRTESLKLAIDSVLDQKYPNVNILVCHDGLSEEYNKFVLSNYYPNVSYYFNSKNYNDLGAHSRNKMLGLVKDDSYVIFLDDDNFLFPDSLSELNTVIENNDKLIISNILVDSWEGKNYIFPRSENIIMSEIDTLCMCVSGILAKKTEWDDINGAHDFRYAKKLEEICIQNSWKIQYTDLFIGRHGDKTNLESKEVVIISCHSNTNASEDKTIECINAIKKTGKKIILTSHFPVSNKLQEIVDYYIYDKNNPITTHDFYSRSWFTTEDYYAEIDLTKNNNNSYHGIGCLINYYNGMSLAKDLGFELAHCINFDIIISNSDIHVLDDISKWISENNKQGYFLSPVEKEGMTFKTVFFSCKPEYFLQHFKYPHSEKEYTKFILESGSESNGLENYFYNNLKDNLEDLATDEMTEDFLFPNSDINSFSMIEYFTVLPYEDKEDKFVVWYNSSNVIDSRNLDIKVYKDEYIILGKCLPIDTDFKFTEIIDYDQKSVYKIECIVKNENDEILKDKKIEIFSYDDIKDNGIFKNLNKEISVNTVKIPNNIKEEFKNLINYKFNINNFNIRKEGTNKLFFIYDNPNLLTSKVYQVQVCDITSTLPIYRFNMNVDYGEHWCVPFQDQMFNNYGLLKAGYLIKIYDEEYNFCGQKEFRLRQNNFNTKYNYNHMDSPINSYIDFMYNDIYGDFIKNSKKIIDAGANIGAFIEYVRLKNKNIERIIAIEPVPETFGYLNSNFEFPELVKINKALYSDITTIQIFSSDNASVGSSIIKSNDNDSTFIDVETITLESIVEEYGNFDLLKLDIEGAEFDVFETLNIETLQKIDKIILEYHHNDQEDIKLRKVLDKLDEAGFIYSDTPNFEKTGIELNGYHMATFFAKRQIK